MSTSPPPVSPLADLNPGCSVVVDARALNHSGIGRYLREILRQLLQDRRFSRIVLAGRPAELTSFVAAATTSTRVEIVSFPHAFYSVAAQLHWAALEARGRLDADVVFYPHYDVPLTVRARPSVLVVHDLIHFRLDRFFSRSKRVVASVVLAAAVRRSAAVIVPSESTRGDLLARHRRVADRVEVIPSGVSGDFCAGSSAESVGGRPLAEWQPYLLCVGNRKPHKNLVAAVEELSLLLPTNPDLRLVLVGPSFGDLGVAERARELGVSQAVAEIDAVSEAELRALYRGADALLFPSLYEGFGLPILEAMACGVPVVASNRASIPEVVGEAGLIVDPDERGAMASAVRRLWTEPGLRDRLASLGLERAKAMTWEATGARTTEVLLRVARDARRQ